MLPRVSLLEELRKGGFEASLVTTFNAYLPFYEEVILRRLINAGVRHNVLLMDAQQYAASVASHPPRFAGRQYTLLPAKVPGAFHPKLIFLAGKNKGLILVGSHNATLAGFGFNRELTNLVRIEGPEDAAGIALAQHVWTEIDHWLAQFTEGVPAHVEDMVRRVGEFAPWLKADAVADGMLTLLAARPGGQPLWEQFRGLIEGDTAELAICGAFFDRDLGFLKRIRQDLPGAAVAVAIQPKTVQISPQARQFPGLTLVCADRLGGEANEETNSSYLHAKGILARQRDGSAVFASGSANPSVPAWLSSETSGNVELMIARRGDEALAAAQAVGFSNIHAMPSLDDADWQTIEQNTEEQPEVASPGYRTGLAAAEDERVLVDLGLLAGMDNPIFVLSGADSEEISRTGRFTQQNRCAVVAFAAAEIASAFALHVLVGDEPVLKLLLHHVRLIEEQARSGTQRRFKEALLSLETDTPNIELLIQCIDKILFSEERATMLTGIRGAVGREQGETAEAEAPTTLAIDVSEVNKRRSKQRLMHSGDFAYLLDALIYHLRLEDNKSVEELDRFGRSEEEQIGADDDADAEAERITAEKQDELLRVCHSKVGTLVSRMVTQLEAFSAGKQPLADVLIRLLGVLAVLRELRGCDGRVAWVEKGKTTVPEAQRLRLFEGIMFNLSERNALEDHSSLLHLAPLGDEFEGSDEVARLKGLVLWLAWDCRLTLNLHKPFNESREDLKQRLRRNAMVLALAQMMRADEVVIDEARQSIGSLTTSELDWLTGIQRLAERCTALKEDHETLRSADRAEPGDIAVHKTVGDWDLRIVAASGGNRISLICLAKDKDQIVYRPEHLAVLPLTWQS